MALIEEAENPCYSNGECDACAARGVFPFDSDVADRPTRGWTIRPRDHEVITSVASFTHDREWKEEGSWEEAPYITSGEFLGFSTPPPPLVCIFGLIYSTKFALTPLLMSAIGPTPPPLCADVLYIWFAMREEDVLAGYTLSGGSPDNLGSACCSRTIALVLRI